MATNLPDSLPPLSSSLKEFLFQLRSRLGLNLLTVSQLAWAAFHRNWDSATLEAWAKGEKGVGPSRRHTGGT